MFEFFTNIFEKLELQLKYIYIYLISNLVLNL